MNITIRMHLFTVTSPWQMDWYRWILRKRDSHSFSDRNINLINNTTADSDFLRNECLT